ncbi:MAG TPA: acyl-CoA dehydrogenase family protein [Iamia sp.]|nr:acyl-CoA dehydrogenase family protein [Iamia sp.]
MTLLDDPPTTDWLTTARALVPELAAATAAHDRDGTFVQDGMDLVRDRGLLAMLVPADLGGGGATFGDACSVLTTLAHGCPATSLTLSMHMHLIAAQVWRHHRDLPAPVLPRVAAEGLVLVSTGAADWIDSSGVARKVEGGYRVTGRKMPASGAPAGAVVVTSARWEDAPDGPQVVHMSIPFSAEGVSVEETWDAMGMRGTGSHTVVLDDVFVPDAAVPLVRAAGEWHPVWATVLGCALPLIMATYVGVAEAAVARVLELAARRAERPETAPAVGRMVGQLAAAQDTLAAMVRANDDLRFDPTIENAAAALTRKGNGAAAAIEAVRLSLEVGGGRAFAVGGGVEQLLRDVHGATYHPLPPAAQQLFTGRVALGLDPLGGR